MSYPRGTHWAILSITYTPSPSGVKITVITNNRCHLECRQTRFRILTYRKRRKWRGIWLCYDKHITVRVKDYEWQNESGDTTVHTFDKEPWPECETASLYFRGTLEGRKTPSTSPIFEYHKPHVPVEFWLPFYPDHHEEITSVDGHCRNRDYEGLATWEQIHDNRNDIAEDDSPVLTVAFSTSPTPWYWLELWRSILLFDTHVIPPSATILDAQLTVRGLSKQCWYEWQDAMLAVCPSDPASDTSIIPEDTNTIGGQTLSQTITYTAWDAEGYNTFNLNPYGLAAINKGGITKLAIREVTYDAADHEPEWVYNQSFAIQIHSADALYPDRWPVLTVHWHV